MLWVIGLANPMTRGQLKEELVSKSDNANITFYTNQSRIL